MGFEIMVHEPNQTTFQYTSSFSNFSLGNSGQHYVKSVRVRKFSGPYLLVFQLNTARYMTPRIQYKYEKIRTRKTPNKDTFNAVQLIDDETASSADSCS